MVSVQWTTKLHHYHSLTPPSSKREGRRKYDGERKGSWVKDNLITGKRKKKAKALWEQTEETIILGFQSASEVCLRLGKQSLNLHRGCSGGEMRAPLGLHQRVWNRQSWKASLQCLDQPCFLKQHLPEEAAQDCVQLGIWVCWRKETPQVPCATCVSVQLSSQREQ